MSLHPHQYHQQQNSYKRQKGRSPHNADLPLQVQHPSSKQSEPVLVDD